MGGRRFGDGYVDALRASYPDLLESADYVAFWWYRAAQEVAAGRTTRAGLITTKAIAQGQKTLSLRPMAEPAGRRDVNRDSVAESKRR